MLLGYIVWTQVTKHVTAHYWVLQTFSWLWKLCVFIACWALVGHLDEIAVIWIHYMPMILSHWMDSGPKNCVPNIIRLIWYDAAICMQIVEMFLKSVRKSCMEKQHRAVVSSLLFVDACKISCHPEHSQKCNRTAVQEGYEQWSDKTWRHTHMVCMVWCLWSSDT